MYINSFFICTSPFFSYMVLRIDKKMKMTYFINVVNEVGSIFGKTQIFGDKGIELYEKCQDTEHSERNTNHL